MGHGGLCSGLIVPPRGGGQYFAAISGGATRECLPRTRVLNVVGTLSSSTQMYSISLGTSPGAVRDIAR